MHKPAAELDAVVVLDCEQLVAPHSTMHFANASPQIPASFWWRVFEPLREAGRSLTMLGEPLRVREPARYFANSGCRRRVYVQLQNSRQNLEAITHVISYA